MNAKILAAIADGAQTRREIAAASGITYTALDKALAALAGKGKIERHEKVLAGGTGRGYRHTLPGGTPAWH